jgi:hypothetical protein
MNFCTCDEFHKTFLSKYYNFVHDGGYDRVLVDISDEEDSRVFSTQGFTKKLDEIEILCPTHHPFIYYLAGIVHLKPSDVQSAIKHAWTPKSSGNLNIYFKGAHAPMRVIRGIHKAWRGFSGHPRSSVCYYTSELGHMYGENADDYEDYVPNTWDILGNLGSAVWSAKF